MHEGGGEASERCVAVCGPTRGCCGAEARAEEGVWTVRRTCANVLRTARLYSASVREKVFMIRPLDVWARGDAWTGDG